MDAAVVTARRASFANGPGGKILASLAKGTVVAVRGGPPAWVEIEVGGEIGVISRRAFGLPPRDRVGLEAPAAPPAVPPAAKPSDITVSGAKVLGPGSIRFGTLHKLGLYNYGATISPNAPRRP